MSCITMLLKSSDVMAVRKAVFSAGASRVVISPLPKSAWAAYFQEWCSGKADPHADTPVKIDVSIEACCVDGIVAAFLNTAHAGKIERIVITPAKTKNSAPALLQAA